MQTANGFVVTARSKNPVISADLLDSCHSFIRVIRDCERSERSRWHKISIKRSRMVTNDANCTNVRTHAHHHKIDVFSLEFSIVPVVTNMLQTRHSSFP